MDPQSEHFVPEAKTSVSESRKSQASFASATPLTLLSTPVELVGHPVTHGLALALVDSLSEPHDTHRVGRKYVLVRADTVGEVLGFVGVC